MRNFEALNKYTIVGEAGSGGMGRVFEAHQLGADGFVKTVAIKFIHHELAGSPEFTAMFISEAKLVADLVHPNIVQIYQLGRQDNAYFICMEFIEGVDLRAFLARHRRVPLELATFIVSRVARALEYAHAKRDRQGRPLNIVHRDVSPKNIMITSEGEVKLADFGMAAHVLAQAQEDQVMGSVEYMSPEQARGDATGPTSDIFSLGLVYYELLTGVSPLQSENLSETLTRLLTGQIPPAKSLRPEMAEEQASIVRRCLEPDPGQRFQSAGELSFALESQMYRGGYGPTIVTLARYLSEGT